MTQFTPELFATGAIPQTIPIQKNLNKLTATEYSDPLDMPAAPCLVTDFIRYQVEANPNEYAVHVENEHPYTYSELWQLVEHIAAKASFTPGTIVPICLDPSVEFVATIVAILLSGAAYVVLDPEGSVERNQVIAADCGEEAVVAHKKYIDLFDRATSIENLLSVRGGPETFYGAVSSSPSDLAYLIYTSGSTGKPKGVLLSHRAASHGISQFELNGRRRWLLFYNPVFSAAQRTILATLSKGACLCLAPRQRLATSLPEVLTSLQIDALGITPSALALLSPADIPDCLQQITTVGEPLSQNLVDIWADIIHLRVSYGLSECAQLNFSRQLKVGDNPRNPGRPIDTTTAVILEPGTTIQVPAGEAGELCLYGAQIANGYYLRTKETASAFVKNPFGPGSLFRTGDQAVCLPDGTFEILGRIDHQIKIHGQRVEPQEVAANLTSEDGVSAIVCVGAYIKGSMALVAAVTPDVGTNWSDLVKRLRSHAQRSFPPYMVPSYWLRCQELPVNRNGKVDVKAIRSLAESVDVTDLLGREASPERKGFMFSEIGSEIVQIWSSVLQLRPSAILPTDSFVALGGTSIEAIRVIRELRTRGIHIELADMLQSQTVEDIADSSRLEPQGAKSARVPEPFSLLADEALKAELLADRGILDAFPTTALQEGILASTLQGNRDYLYQRVYDVRHLDLVRFQLAFQVVFWQSETLRSTFTTSSNGFAQVVKGDATLPWNEISMPLGKYLESDKEKGVTLGEPFIRVAVLDSSILVVSVHHALFDYWSHGFVFDDVARLYYGILPEKRALWKSFVALLQDQPKTGSEEFWRTHLAEAAPTVLNHAPVEQASTVSHTLSVDLRSAAAALQAPSSAIFYAAWAFVLSTHTASKSVTMATAISGRELPLEGIEALDGPTLAMVPQSVLINPENTLLELVRSVNGNLWNIIKHSQFGIRKALAAGGHQNTTLFDTMVNILVRGQDPEEITDEVFQTYGTRPAWRTEYTTLNIEEGAKGIEISLTAPMERKRLEFIVSQFSRAVQLIIENPRQTVGSVSLVEQPELDFLLEWNKNQPAPTTLHGEFEKMARQYPERIALNFENKEILTYAQLDESADRMANFFTERGMESGDVVPLLLEKSHSMIITILALFKIGAAYVPLSPENPVERNSFIARDVGARFLVTETEHAEVLSLDGVTNILIDQARLCKYSADKIEYSVSPNALAYILYTSGSTGQPKGVTIQHGACAAAMRSIIDFEDKQGVPFKALQFSNYVFDVSLYDFFVTLHAGGTLCVATSDRLLGDLAGAINDMGVNHVFLTPTVARLLDPKDVPGLESMTVGGEQLTRDVVTTWAPKVFLRNGYGPTEASVLVTMKDVTLDTIGGNIGRPLASVGAVILEADGIRPVPYGAVGEVCFWGPQLSEGYFKKPDLTSAAFVTSELIDGRMLYRSGDLARYVPGGDIECLGRKDDQVKVNGHRIELGEIEQVILRTGEVTDCILTVWKHEKSAHLVANVVFNAIADDDVPLTLDMFEEEALRLKNNLNDLAHYMFPKFIIPLAALPRLPSGKANRKQLKAQVQAMTQAELSQFSFDKIGMGEAAEVIPLVNDTQRALQQAWVDILGLLDAEFGQEANFLSLGGDSVSAINLVSTLRRKGLTLSVRDVLKNPVLGDMAAQIQSESEEEAVEAVIFNAPEELGALTSAAGVQEDEYEYAEFLTQGARDQTFWFLMAIRSVGQNFDAANWINLTKQLTETNEILRTTFTRADNKWYGVVLQDATPVVEIYDVADDAQRKQIIDALWADKFVFGKPFIRYAILNLADGETQIVTKLDHGLYDGTLLRVFDAHFQAYQHGTELESFTPFKDFAFHIWQINQTKPTLDFWKQDDKKPINFQFPAIAEPSINSTVVRVINLDFEQYSRSTGATVSIIFQSIFQMWLSLRSSKKSVAFDYLYTGRNVDLPDPQSINGTCANFLPMRSEVEADTLVKDFLLRTQDDFWLYTENCTVGIEDICEANGVTREDCGNRALFLFQPFEPAAPGAAQVQTQKWVVMAKSQVTMPQPYAIVFEVMKTADPNGYKLKFAYDNTVWTKEEVEVETEVVEQMLRTIVENQGAKIGDVFQI
ncbi:Nonribosomal peptide synthase sidE [Cladobotryum mycophilum]|uniref:Nonribosomal peptide synthase sidE n=1 Tax=Cladobotryum mycophilum TaxID=491253 RepID=A0ABR0T283_9HYPO